MNHKRVLWALLALALLLRLAYGLGQDHLAVYGDTGGDAGWYLANGYALTTGFDNDYLPRPDGSSYPIILKTLPTPPLYLLFVGFWQALLAPEAAVIAIRVVQALLGTATVWLAYRLARDISGDERAALVTAAVLAVSPAFLMENGQIATETLYLFLLAVAFVVYGGADGRRVVLAGALFGLATLTRAVLLLFPLGLALHLLLAYGWRRGLRLAGLLLLSYALVVSTWTLYSYARWQRVVIAGEGFAAFLYVGATAEGWQGGESLDTALPASGEDDRQSAFTEGAQAIITSDPAGYLTRRVRELAGAFMQPHGTLLFSGPSLRQLMTDWLREDRSLPGLLVLTRAEAFWPKAALYAFHFSGILLALAGLWRGRGRWRVWLPLAGMIAYTLLIHLLLTALPRYLFPIDLCAWILASLALLKRQQHE